MKGLSPCMRANYGTREKASGEYFLLLNNDTEVISENRIEEMLAYAPRPDVGAAGTVRAVFSDPGRLPPSVHACRVPFISYLRFRIFYRFFIIVLPMAGPGRL